jgi:hypothetical protein
MGLALSGLVWLCLPVWCDPLEFDLLCFGLVWSDWIALVWIDLFDVLSFAVDKFFLCYII